MFVRRVEAWFIFLFVILSFPVLVITLGRVEAGWLTDPGQMDAEDLITTTDVTGEATATGFVYYDGVAVAGAEVDIFLDGTRVYTATTELGSGTVPSFTVTLSDPPISAIPDDILTLQAKYGADESNVSYVRVTAGEQTMPVWLSSSCGETEITTGPITTNTTWTPECGPYLIRTNVLVNTGVTLTIDPGTTIIFDADRAIQINGRLLTPGSINALVAFTAPEDHPWGYLTFSSSSTGSILTNTLFEFAGNLTSAANNATIRVDGSDPIFNGVIVRESEDDGIEVYNNGDVTMDDLVVLNNTGWGIYADTTHSNLTIQNSSVSGNGEGGIYVTGDAAGTISDNTVEFNGESGIYLIRAVGPITISHNRIVGNEAYRGGGIYFYRTDGPILDNYIANNEASNLGGGIYYNNTHENDIKRNYIILNRGFHSSQAAGGVYLYGWGTQVTNNIFASNIAMDTETTNPGPGAGLYIANSPGVVVRQNAFVYNFAKKTPGAAVFSRHQNVTLEANTIFSNTATSSPLGDWAALQFTEVPVLTHNNIFQNRTYDLYNDTASDVDATAQWWGTTNPAEISTQIYDYFDDATLGIVDYAGWLTEPWTAAPVSPPSITDIDVDGSTMTVTWTANPESDLAGYKIYLDDSEQVFDPAVHGEIEGIDVGPVTSFTFTCLPLDVYYLAVTAYDQDADGVNDWTDGYESWFSREEAVVAGSIIACDPPTTPTSLSAAQFSASQINLSWTDNADDETSYRVERSPNGSTDWSEIGSAGVDATSYGDGGLACGMTYYYRVRAYRAGDGQYSGYSNVDDAATIACLPSAPTDLIATAISASQINLTWTDNANDETAYRVERSPNGSTGWNQIASLGANVEAYSDTGRTCDTTYYYRVRAYRDGDGQYSGYSNIDHDTTDACPPATPTDLSATAVSTSQINLSWTDNAGDETAYRVERSPNGSTGWSQIADLAANTEAYSDTGRSCGTTYYYRVRAYRSGDGQYSGYSNVDNASTTNCIPAAPTDLSATAVSDSQIDLSWTDNADDETAYRVERSPNGSTGWIQIASLAAGSEAYSDTGRSCDTIYYYRVRAYRAGDSQYSGYSNIDHDTTDACPPATPTDLSATAVSASQINLSWTDNAGDETSYRVERSPTGNSHWDEIAILGANVEAYNDPALACNTEYFYRVRAYRAGDGLYSDYSSVDQATTSSCVGPDAPSNLAANEVSASQINLSWSDNADDETGYRVERSPNGISAWDEIASLGANIEAYSDPGLACNSTYYYRVRAYRAGDGQYSEYSNIDQATTSTCEGSNAPTNLTAGAVSSTQIDLSWIDNAGDETAYRVERSPNGLTDWIQIASLGANSTAYSDTGLVYLTTYFYRVRAYRSGDGQYSGYSNIDQATTWRALYLPMLIRTNLAG